MNLLIEHIKKNEEINNIKELLEKNENSKILIDNLTDSAKAILAYALTFDTKKSSVIVCNNILEANKLIQNLKEFSEIEIIYFPSKSLEYYDIEAESLEIRNQRLYAINKILKNEKNIIVTTIDSFLTKMYPKEKYNTKDFKLNVGDNIDFEKLVETLVSFGFERSNTVEGKGQFSVRGGIIDIFLIDNELPFRIEFFGDEIDNIRTFDVMTQRSIDTVKSINISCASEDLITKEEILNVIQKIEEVSNKKEISKELRDVLNADIERIKEGNLENIYDKYFETVNEKYDTFFDYIKNYNIFFLDIDKCKSKIDSIIYENNETIKILTERKYIYPSFVNKYLDFNFVHKKLNEFNTIYLENICTNKEVKKESIYFQIECKEYNFYKNSLDVMLNDIKRNSALACVLVFPSDARVEQIKNYLSENKINVELLDGRKEIKKFWAGHVYIKKGILSDGFLSLKLNTLLIVEQVSGISYNKTRKLKKSEYIGSKINTYEDLEIGDFVVHENHGIGIYRGIETIKVQDTKKDYIKIEYANNGMLYVPINQLDSVGKYICDDGTKPKINSLGGTQWEKTKKKVTEHVEKMAKELALLYAQREKMEGFAFGKDEPWQKEFEDSFEYELTPDQKESISEIKKDMESKKPMDRLLCGDVGYGKTEVALRAAFKAVVGGKQVAYLVPTTVLCLQQYRTFKSRMENFGINVEMLCRFRNKKEQTQILKDLVDGKIDVIVGTHRLLSKDVFFDDLGLLIIDEEHRFGVKAKETIKELKKSVDVLSMTATPIPRTLHMSMVGIRSMSTLTEPPMERLPVHTYVLEYDENVIKQAIEKELARDGQVFYMNNRVENIEEVTLKVQNLVPGARVSYAHGKMTPEEIEDIMLKFMNHEIDILVCTTILESGIDIKNANTIIVENADKLGLAQLYQIRGRVGRSSRLAYAYITYSKNKQLSEVSQKRLKAIKDFTEFGSGFKIALRDLEIRGAGNLLGKEQHGQMAKVGYELYLALLEKAVKNEKEGIESKDLKQSEDVKIDIDISAYISDDYIKDPMQKIAIYQKISDIKTKEDSLDLIDELIDRFGDIPKETENLIKIVEIRNEARKLGITRIFANDKMIRFDPINYRLQLTNNVSNDILIAIELEISKLKKDFKKEKEEG